MNKYSAVLLIAAVSGCETTPRIYTNAQAIALCEDKARSAAGPRGEAEFGFGTEGTSAGLSLSFDESFLRGRDPNVVYTECLDQLRRNGQISEPGTSN
jgi:hypothetical protein